MALRLIEIILPNEHAGRVPEVIEAGPSAEYLGAWTHPGPDGQTLVKVLVTAEDTESVIDALHKQFSQAPGFRVLVLPVEASIPRPEPPEETRPDTHEAAGAPPASSAPVRISRQELYADVTEGVKPSRTYFGLVVLSSIVAAIGLQRGNVAVIIGAMVIAPLLGPNVALALATTLGDTDLIRRALRVLTLGLLTSFALSLFLGFALRADASVPEIASRTHVGLGDIVLALAAGTAGVLSFTTGLPAALVGVMVAVALVPPLVTAGMLLGTGAWPAALGAMLLLATNVICVNLAGVTTLLVQGVRPITWWEADQARRATRRAIAFWTVSLVALAVIVILAQRR